MGNTQEREICEADSPNADYCFCATTTTTTASTTTTITTTITTTVNVRCSCRVDNTIAAFPFREASCHAGSTVLNNTRMCTCKPYLSVGLSELEMGETFSVGDPAWGSKGTTCCYPEGHGRPETTPQGVCD